MKQQETAERIVRLETTVEEIKTNHLPHIQAGVDKIDNKLSTHMEKEEVKFDRFEWLLITTLVTALVSVALKLAK